MSDKKAKRPPCPLHVCAELGRCHIHHSANCSTRPMTRKELAERRKEAEGKEAPEDCNAISAARSIAFTFARELGLSNSLPIGMLIDRLEKADLLVEHKFPVINAQFYTKCGEAIGTTTAPILKVDKEDDGSFTVVIDHWPSARSFENIVDAILRVPIRFKDDEETAFGEIPVYIDKHIAENFAREIVKPNVGIGTVEDEKGQTSE